MHLIDTHQHVFWQGRDDRGLIEDMDAHQIKYAWLLTWDILPIEDNPEYHRNLNPQHFRADGTHAGIPLEDLLKARDHFPDRFVVGYCPHPAIPGAPDRLRDAVKKHGVRACGEWKFRMLIDDPRSLELFQVAGELGLPVVLHLDVPYLYQNGRRTYQPSWYGGTVENLERCLRSCPQTNFIGHAPGFWREISGDAEREPEAYPSGPCHGKGQLHRLFDEYPNLYADLSAHSGLMALKRDLAHAVEFLKSFGDRLLFGRDRYGQDLWSFLKTLPLSTELQDKLYHANAEKLIPILLCPTN